MGVFLGKGDVKVKAPESIRAPGGSAPEGGRETAVDTLSQTASPFKVVLFNDEEHTYDYVVEMLTHVCKLSRDNAFRCAVEVDITGRTVVYYGSRSDCAGVRSQIAAYGPDHRLPQSMGSMNAEVQAH